MGEITRTGGWTYDPDNAEMPTITLTKMDLQASNIPDDLGLEDLDLAALGCPWGGNYLGHSGLEVPFRNHTWDDGGGWSRMTFYELRFFFYIPEGCPAGILFIDTMGDADGNIWYENTWDEATDYPMFYN